MPSTAELIAAADAERRLNRYGAEPEPEAAPGTGSAAKIMERMTPEYARARTLRDRSAREAALADQRQREAVRRAAQPATSAEIIERVYQPGDDAQIEIEVTFGKDQ